MSIRNRTASTAARTSARWLRGCLAAVLLAAPATAYETDPYTNRHLDIADSIGALNAQVNAALAAIAETSTARHRGEQGLVLAVYRRLGGVHWVDRLERWAIGAPAVAKIPNTRGESIIGDFPLFAGRVAVLFGFGPTINIGGHYVGTDKIGHFFSQGRKFYRRYRRSGSEAQAARWSVVTETGLFGSLTTGVRSNADLVANYEGYRFYRSLLHDGVVAAKPAIYRREGDDLVQQRPFTWRDHVNAFWDEALNPNEYGSGLMPAVRERLLRLCADFAARPERYRVDAESLLARYRHIGVTDTQWLAPANYLPAHCRVAAAKSRAGGCGAAAGVGCAP